MSDKLKDNYLLFRRAKHEFYALKIGRLISRPLRVNPEKHEITAVRIKYAMSSLDALYQQLLTETNMATKEVMEGDKI